MRYSLFWDVTQLGTDFSEQIFCPESTGADCTPEQRIPQGCKRCPCVSSNWPLQLKGIDVLRRNKHFVTHCLTRVISSGCLFLVSVWLGQRQSVHVDHNLKFNPGRPICSLCFYCLSCTGIKLRNNKLCIYGCPSVCCLFILYIYLAPSPPPPNLRSSPNLMLHCAPSLCLFVCFVSIQPVWVNL